MKLNSYPSASHSYRLATFYKMKQWGFMAITDTWKSVSDVRVSLLSRAFYLEFVHNLGAKFYIGRLGRKILMLSYVSSNSAWKTMLY